MAKSLIEHVATAGMDFIYGQLHVDDNMIRCATAQLVKVVSEEHLGSNLDGILERFVLELQSDCNIPQMKTVVAKTQIKRALKDAIEEYDQFVAREADLARLSNILQLAKQS